jgi:hypothetical protein
MPRIIAAAQVKNGLIETASAGVTYENEILHFPNPGHLKFVPVISDCEDKRYITETHWIQQLGPDYVHVRRKPNDTSDRTSAGTDFTVVVVSID